MYDLRNLSMAMLLVYSIAWLQTGLSRCLPNQGTLRLFVNESEFAVAKFDRAASGNFHSEVTISMAGQTAKQKLDLRADATGIWVSAKIQTPLGAISLMRVGFNVQVGLLMPAILE